MYWAPTQERILPVTDFLSSPDAYGKYRANGIEQEVRAEPIFIMGKL